jgi:hypothetical protein
VPSTARLALRKYTDFIRGTEKDTTANKTVAIRVIRKPGVAGLMKLIRKQEGALEKY